MSMRAIASVSNSGGRRYRGLGTMVSVTACSSRESCSRYHRESQELSSRRNALKSLVAGLVASSSLPAEAASGMMMLPREKGDNSARQGEIRHSDEEWRNILSADQYAVLREAATERRFTSSLVDEHRKGVFKCAGCGADLYSSSAKYESGTGWPSFYEALPGAVDEVLDKSIPFMPRQEVRCHRCQSHLGHVFDDGPAPTGLRYCMNGLALEFVPDAL